ncbi:MAG TPA: NUDIX hydrolase [Bacteroidota bacterium]|nr:NUDIX hydrolase [Bacteroidota bacterium]
MSADAGGTGGELRLLSRELLYTGRVIDLIVDRVEYPSGAAGVREIARHPGGSVIVPLLDDGRVLLVTQLRYPIGGRVTELPAGKLSAGEEPSAAALRELAEETGYSASALEHLVTVYTTPGFCDERLHIYMARGLRPVPGGPRREEGELTMTVEAVPLDEAVRRALRGELPDAKTIIGLLLAWERLRNTTPDNAIR